jgi:hypothetical protein
MRGEVGGGGGRFEECPWWMMVVMVEPRWMMVSARPSESGEVRKRREKNTNHEHSKTKGAKGTWLNLRLMSKLKSMLMLKVTCDGGDGD